MKTDEWLTYLDDSTSSCPNFIDGSKRFLTVNEHELMQSSYIICTYIYTYICNSFTFDWGAQVSNILWDYFFYKYTTVFKISFERRPDENTYKLEHTWKLLFLFCIKFEIEQRVTHENKAREWPLFMSFMWLKYSSNFKRRVQSDRSTSLTIISDWLNNALLYVTFSWSDPISFGKRYNVVECGFNSFTVDQSGFETKATKPPIRNMHVNRCLKFTWGQGAI